MDQFEIYRNLQNLLIVMKNEEEEQKVKQFITDNNLFKNQKRAFSTIRLIASVVYSRPFLLNNAVHLLTLFKTTNIYPKIKTKDPSNIEVINRMKVLHLLLMLSKQSKSVISNANQDEKPFLNPFQNMKQIEEETKKFYNGQDQHITIKKEKIVELRNTLHSFHPAVQAIKDDNLQLLQEIIDQTKIQLESELPESFNEIHEILRHANLIEYAAFFGSIQCFSYIQSKQEKINYNKLLEYAIAGGNTEIIHKIEETGNLVEQNQNLLYLAILYMNNDLIDYVIQKYNVKINSESYIKCLYSSNYDALLKLKEKDNSNEINSFGEIGSAPIDIASFEGCFVFFKYLTKIADVKTYNSFGKNILHSAVRNNNLDIVKYIVKHKLVDLNDKGDYGITPYEIAQQYNLTNIYQFLAPYYQQNNE